MKHGRPLEPVTGKISDVARAGRFALSKWEIGIRAPDGTFQSFVPFPKRDVVIRQLIKKRPPREQAALNAYAAARSVKRRGPWASAIRGYLVVWFGRLRFAFSSKGRKQVSMLPLSSLDLSRSLSSLSRLERLDSSWQAHGILAASAQEQATAANRNAVSHGPIPIYATPFGTGARPWPAWCARFLPRSQYVCRSKASSNQDIGVADVGQSHAVIVVGVCVHEQARVSSNGNVVAHDSSSRAGQICAFYVVKQIAHDAKRLSQ